MGIIKLFFDNSDEGKELRLARDIRKIEQKKHKLNKIIEKFFYKLYFDFGNVWATTRMMERVFPFRSRFRNFGELSEVEKIKCRNILRQKTDKFQQNPDAYGSIEQIIDFNKYAECAEKKPDLIRKLKHSLGIFFHYVKARRHLDLENVIEARRLLESAMRQERGIEKKQKVA